ncbi:glycosyltransferase family 4 protein [Treponema brennaborense]|uniref:Glycosyl transferase group 1 n=1 Tax=Treponema brennaborense (strain DSM 12168 / CIP 105900 / DD5/3) TaxID=906968 RepID=F4LIJ5_TREBD|nr:glycosyltransferase family 4 protein [Treponema brennaborense]AEE17220.1 glycosyl transferase group 1 [Treponema brennaborense DSM 12168]
MKICIFTNHFYPEDFKINDIAFELVKKGYDVTIITAVPDYPQGKFFDGYSWHKRNRENVNGCHVIRLPILSRGKGEAKRLALQYLSYYISSSVFTFFHKFFHNYDAVFVHLTSPFFIGIPATKLKKYQKIPMIFWTLDLWPESITAAAGIANPLILKFLTKQVQYVYNNADKILIGSKGFEKSILEKGKYKEKLVYFPNWCESATLPEDIERYKHIEPFSSFSDKEFVVLFAGNIGESQNLDCVLDAAIEISKQKPEIKFIFLGDGRARVHLVQRATSSAIINKTVFFPGRFPLESMPYFMSRASILLVSLKDELIFNLTIPSKVQFYMAQEKPILAMLNGDGADLINEAKCGFTVSANDKIAFVKELFKISMMPKEKLLQMGKNGKNYYEQSFRKEQRIEQLEEILR